MSFICPYKTYNKEMGQDEWTNNVKRSNQVMMEHEQETSIITVYNNYWIRLLFQR